MRKSVAPNFFIIGAAKAATTSLSSLLARHPQAAIARPKEPHFFSHDRCYGLGWEQYLKLYSHCDNEKAIGDASTSYSRIRYHPATIDRMMRHAPNAKIIYMVRHPLERMESAYVEHMCSPSGHVFTSINDAVQRQPMIIDSSRYWEVFDAYRRSFGESRIKIVWFEEYVAHTEAVFQEVCRFLEIDDMVLPNLGRQHLNSRQDAAKRLAMLGRNKVRIDTAWDGDIQQRVIGLIRDDICRFLAHFGRPMDYWSDTFRNEIFSDGTEDMNE